MRIIQTTVTESSNFNKVELGRIILYTTKDSSDWDSQHLGAFVSFDGEREFIEISSHETIFQDRKYIENLSYYSYVRLDRLNYETIPSIQPNKKTVKWRTDFDEIKSNRLFTYRCEPYLDVPHMAVILEHENKTTSSELGTKTIQPNSNIFYMAAVYSYMRLDEVLYTPYNPSETL